MAFAYLRFGSPTTHASGIGTSTSPRSSTSCPSSRNRAARFVTLRALGPMSTPRRLAPRSRGTPMMATRRDMARILLQRGGPVQDDGQGLADGGAEGVHDEALAVGGDVVGVLPPPLEREEERRLLARHDRSVPLFDRHADDRGVVVLAVIDLLPVASPAREHAARRGDLPSPAPGRVRERLDVDLLAPRFVGRVRDEASIGREGDLA